MKGHAALAALVLAGCASAPSDAYQWVKAEDISETRITKIETTMAPEFCGALYGNPAALGCAVRIIGAGRCVMIVRPGDGTSAAHEAGGHCMGYDHR